MKTLWMVLIFEEGMWCASAIFKTKPLATAYGRWELRKPFKLREIEA